MWPTGSPAAPHFGLLVCSLVLGCGGVRGPSERAGPSPERPRGDARAARHDSVAQCPPDWMTYEGSCYGLFSEKKSWPEAESFCRSYGVRGHLVSILDELESDAVASFIQENARSWGPVWIGLFDYMRHISPEYIYKMKREWWWMDAYKVTYTAWHKGEPDLDWKKSCVHLLPATGFQTWKNALCHWESSFVCKYELKYQ